MQLPADSLVESCRMVGGGVELEEEVPEWVDLDVQDETHSLSFLCFWIL